MNIEKIESHEIISEFVEKEFKQYEIQHEVDYNYKPFHFAAKENDEIVGVIAGHTCFSEVYIGDLAVLEKHRGKNIGTKLVQFVEDYFKGSEFNNMNLCTYEFQAPGFYEKLGFQLEFIRKNKDNPKTNKYYFVKYINDNDKEK